MVEYRRVGTALERGWRFSFRRAKGARPCVARERLGQGAGGSQELLVPCWVGWMWHQTRARCWCQAYCVPDLDDALPLWRVEVV